MRFYANISQKNGLKMSISRPFFVKNWHKTANFQNFLKSSLNFVMMGTSGANFS